MTVRTPVDLSALNDLYVRGPPNLSCEVIAPAAFQISGIARGDRVVILASGSAGPRWTDDPAARADVREADDVFLEVGPPAVLSRVVLDADGVPMGAGCLVTAVEEQSSLPHVVIVNDYVPEDWAWARAPSQSHGCADSPMDWAGACVMVTNRVGRFGPAALAPGTYRVEVRGCEPVLVRLAFGEERELTLRPSR